MVSSVTAVVSNQLSQFFQTVKEAPDAFAGLTQKTCDVYSRAAVFLPALSRHVSMVDDASSKIKQARNITHLFVAVPGSLAKIFNFSRQTDPNETFSVFAEALHLIHGLAVLIQEASTFLAHHKYNMSHLPQSAGFVAAGLDKLIAGTDLIEAISERSAVKEESVGGSRSLEEPAENRGTSYRRESDDDVVELRKKKMFDAKIQAANANIAQATMNVTATFTSIAAKFPIGKAIPGVELASSVLSLGASVAKCTKEWFNRTAAYHHTAAAA